MRTAVSATKGVQAESMIGIGAKGDKLIAYAYGKGSWIRVVANCEVEEGGSAILDKGKFLALIEQLKDEVTLRTTTQGKVKIKPTKSSKDEYTLSTVNLEMPRPRLPDTAVPAKLKAAALRDQLDLCTLSGELTGGGYRVIGENNQLTIMATDRVRLVITKQHLTEPLELKLSIHVNAVKGVVDVLKAQPEAQVEIRQSRNLTSFTALLPEEGCSIEFGYQNTTELFPDTERIANCEHPNSGRFESADLLTAITKADALADDELPFADFNFESSEICKLESKSAEGSASIAVDCPSDVNLEVDKIIRLQLPHLKQLLGKAKSCGAHWVTCAWGQGLPAYWRFDFGEAEDKKYAGIDMLYITAPVNRQA